MKTKRIARWMLTVALLVPAAAMSTWAQDAPAKDETTSADAGIDKDSTLDVDLSERKAIVLSMADAVRLTLQNNMDIKIRRIDPQSSAADITKAEAEFDWTFVGSYSKSRARTPSASALTGAAAAMSDTDTIELGLEKKLKTGGSIRPGVSWRRNATNSAFATLNPSYTTDAFFTISQPLLRHAGLDVNRSGIRSAENSFDIAKYNFKTNVINTVASMQNTYWDLVFAIEDLEVKRKSLRLTRDTLDQTRAQVEAGILAPIETLRVRADLAGKEDTILTAQKIVRDREDQLRRFINKRDSSLRSNVGVVPLDSVMYPAVDPNLEDEISQALRYRPDYQSSKISIKNRDIELAVARNGKLPVVDLSATLSMNGLGGDTSDSFRLLGTNDFHDWSGQIEVEVPLGNRAARADYLKARLAKTRAILELKNIEDEVVLDVKEAVRQVQTNLKRIRSTRLARELAEERLRAEEEKFNVGEAVILDVLEAQTNLAQSESNERRAIVDYNKSLITLETAKGTLLERNRILMEADLSPKRK